MARCSPLPWPLVSPAVGREDPGSVHGEKAAKPPAIVSRYIFTHCNTTTLIISTLMTGLLVGLAVKAPASKAADPGFDSRLCHEDFSGSRGTPVVTLPGAWRCRVSFGTGWLGVSILRLGEVQSLNGNFCLSVAALCLSRPVHEIH